MVTVHAGLKTRVRRAEDGGGGISERAIRNKKEREKEQKKERKWDSFLPLADSPHLLPEPLRGLRHQNTARRAALTHSQWLVETRARTHTRRAPRCSSKGAFPPIPCQVNAKLNVSCHCCVLFRLPTTVLRITVPSCFRHPPSTLFFQNDTFFSPSVLFPWFLALIPAPCTHLSIFILSCFLPPYPRACP